MDQFKAHADTAPRFTSTLLTACILLAQFDMHGLLDYALKAGIGGAIWLGYKIVADRFDWKRKPSIMGKDKGDDVDKS